MGYVLILECGISNYHPPQNSTCNHQPCLSCMHMGLDGIAHRVLLLYTSLSYFGSYLTMYHLHYSLQYNAAEHNTSSSSQVHHIFHHIFTKRASFAITSCTTSACTTPPRPFVSWFSCKCMTNIIFLTTSYTA